MGSETDRQIVQAERVEPKVYAAPRRYDLATIFTVTLSYAVLFALMSLVRWPVIVSVVVAGFVTLVAVGQAALFGGKHPRAASLVCGVGSFLAVGIALAIWNGNSAPFNTPYGEWLLGSFALGGTWGYFAGVLVSGVFLMSDMVRRVIKRVRGR